MAAAPAPPRDLDKTARDLFTATRKALTEQGTWQDSDAQLLERYVRSGETARTAREKMEADGGMVSVGSKGQPVPHPLLKVILDAERDQDKRADMLLLSPSARQRLGEKPRPTTGESKFGL